MNDEHICNLAKRELFDGSCRYSHTVNSRNEKCKHKTCTMTWQPNNSDLANRIKKAWNEWTSKDLSSLKWHQLFISAVVNNAHVEL